MGLTRNSTGKGAAQETLFVKRSSPRQNVVALAGNPNVGKSTVFNALTGLKQHTGNWPGKTVSSAQGICSHNGREYVLVDIPGAYSLMAHSKEEEVARGFLLFGGADAVIVVCDATCLERNMNLVLQTIEIMPRTLVCVNLMDQARSRGITLNLPLLSKRLGVPVVGTYARDPRTLAALMDALEELTQATESTEYHVLYPPKLETAMDAVMEKMGKDERGVNGRWLALRLLEGEAEAADMAGEEALREAAMQRQKLLEDGMDGERITDLITGTLMKCAHEVCDGVVTMSVQPDGRDRRLDAVFTGRWSAFPVMLLMLAAVFWLTITGANYPSEWISGLLFRLQDVLLEGMEHIGAPGWLCDCLIRGVYRVVAWVVSVMLPPMAIFFPLFTLLEDSGYLPRVAFNLDRCFKRCRACGKQALTMCMGLGCNAAGVVGCRIIDSPRERLIAILTNSFVPCNGRLPAIISLMTMFFLFSVRGVAGSVLSALGLTGVMVVSTAATLLISKVLSATVLKGMPSSFTLELPPYRRPQIGKVIVRSIFDRTLFVLGRAVSAAAPAGLIIWLMANIALGEQTLLGACAGFLDPLGRLMGLDGVILMAFVLGFPANEIVIPLVLMTYLSEGTVPELGSLTVLRTILTANGWSWTTAVSMIIFFIFHWPCATTCMTIYRETGSVRWTAAAMLLPTAAGVALCMIFNSAIRILGVLLC